MLDVFRQLKLKRNRACLGRVVMCVFLLIIVYQIDFNKGSSEKRVSYRNSGDPIDIVVICSSQPNKDLSHEKMLRNQGVYMERLAFLLDSLFYHSQDANINLHVLAFQRDYDVLQFAVTNMKDVAMTGRNIKVTHEFIELDSVYERLGSQLEFLRSRYTNTSIKENRFLQNEYYIKALYPEVFVSLDKIISLDIDLEFRVSIEELYDEFFKMKSSQAIAMAYDLAPHYRDAFKKYRDKHQGTSIGDPRPGYQGFNDGLFLMDLKKIRNMKNYSYHLTTDGTDYLLKKFRFDPLLGAQDFFTLLGAELPERFHVLDCSFNRQLSLSFSNDPQFKAYHDCEHPVKIYHGNGGVGFPME